MSTEENVRKFEKIFGKTGDQVLNRIRKYSPRLVDHVYDYIAADLYQDSTLDIRTRELCVISALAAQGGLTEQLSVHIKTALTNGVTKEQIISAIETVSTYAGVPRGLNAMFIAIEIFEGSE